MDLHHRYLVAGVVDVFVERDQPWLAGLDELHESRHALPLSLELPCFESVRCDEDEHQLACNVAPLGNAWVPTTESSSRRFASSERGEAVKTTSLSVRFFSDARIW